MHVKYFTSAVAAVALSSGAMVVQASNADDNTEHRWMPKQPVNTYWQAPNFNFPSPGRSAPPVYNPPPQRPMPPANNNYRPQYAQPRPPMQRPRPPAYRPYPSNPGVAGPNANMAPPARMAPPMRNSNRGYPPPPRGPYNGPDNGASAYYMPGYNQNRNYRQNNGWNNNKFWGRSGPSNWMHPNKRNMEQGWDDMINAPSRMGEMPGGWTAPEVSMPNPIDMGDQMQENVKDLPEQIRNMDVGNDN